MQNISLCWYIFDNIIDHDTIRQLNNKCNINTFSDVPLGIFRKERSRKQGIFPYLSGSFFKKQKLV